MVVLIISSAFEFLSLGSLLLLANLTISSDLANVSSLSSFVKDANIIIVDVFFTIGLRNLQLLDLSSVSSALYEIHYQLYRESSAKVIVRILVALSTMTL